MSSQRMLCTNLRRAGAVTTILFVIWCAQMATAQSTGPDITASAVSGSATCPATWGSDESVYGFVGGVTACNIGDTILSGDCCTSNEHPVLAHHLYQLSTNPFERFQQIGISWVKHDDWQGDGRCSGSGPCDSGGLGAGCSDAYSVQRQAGGSPLGPRWSVNAFTGYFPVDETFTPVLCECVNDPPPSCSRSPLCCARVPSDPMRGYMHVKPTELPCSTPATYFLEAHLVSADDSAVGNQFNNVSYIPAQMDWVNTTAPHVL